MSVAKISALRQAVRDSYRIDETVARITRRLPVGNTYVNRNIIGAVVGVQPFGGEGLPAPARKPAARTTYTASPASAHSRSIPRPQAVMPA